MTKHSYRACAAGLLLLAAWPGEAGAGSGPATEDYPSIQAAIDANPGRVIEVPAGIHEIRQAIRIKAEGGGLVGSGKIVQMDPAEAIIRIEHAHGAIVRDLTLTRPEGYRETEAQAIVATDARDVVLADLRVVDNQTRTSAIELSNCVDGRVVDCLVQNYQRVGVDDRTDTPDQGFAFRCIIGTGILIRECQGALIQGNTVREDRLVATPQVKRQFELGKIIKKNAVRGRIASARDWERGETDNWMQGTAVHIASPETTDAIRVLGNLVERAGQGFDIHADRVILSQNIVNDALIGMKAMHGSKHVIVSGNQFIKNTLWSIGMMPGAASLPARAAEGDKPARPANVDGGSIISDNIISDFGLGQTNWIWGSEVTGCPLRFDHAQVPENPPLADVIIRGNVVYDTGRDALIRDGKPEVVPPRYRYAVLIESGDSAPRGLHFSGNILHPGSQGVSNIPLEP